MKQTRTSVGTPTDWQTVTELTLAPNSIVLPSNLLTEYTATASTGTSLPLPNDGIRYTTSVENSNKRPRLNTVNDMLYEKHQFHPHELSTLRIKDFVSLVIIKDMSYRKINNKEYGNVNFEVSTVNSKQKHTKSAHIRLGIALVRHVIDKHADKATLLNKLKPLLPSVTSPDYAIISRTAGQAAEEVETLFIQAISYAYFSKCELNETKKSKQAKEWRGTAKNFGVWIARFEKCKDHNLFQI